MSERASRSPKGRERRLSRILAATFVGSIAIAVAPAGCGVDAHPPVLSDFEGPPAPAPAAASDGGGSDFAVDGAIPVPMCNLGPNGGVCACVDQTLAVTDPPNVYFVLDRSGSMSEGNPSKWQTVIDVIFKVIVDLGPRMSFAVATFPADDGCTAGTELIPPTQGDAPAGAGGPAATLFLTTLGRISPNGGTPTATTLSMLTPRITSLPGKTYVVLATDGGPNCNSAASCALLGDADGGTNECQLNIEGDCLVAMGCCSLDGGTNCCVDYPTSCNDVGPTVAAAQALATLGVPTYVLGIPGSEAYADLLDNLAVAGGTARATEPLYYAVSSSDETAFYNALSAIAAQITATCTLTLSQPPADPTLVNVFLDEVPLAQQSADGGSPNWTLDGSTVTLLGDACQSIQSGEVLDVRVVAGCPTVLR